MFDFIEHVTQPNSFTCTSACLSMITGIDVSVIVEEFHDEWCEHKITPIEYLRRKGLQDIKIFDTYDNRMNPEMDGVYLLTVASINQKGLLHHVIAVSDENKWCILDPAMNREGKLYYSVLEDDDEQSFKIESWDLDFFIPKQEVIKIINKHTVLED